MENINSRGIFDFSFDQTQEYKLAEVIAFLRRDAEPKNLSIAKRPKGFSKF